MRGGPTAKVCDVEMGVSCVNARGYCGGLRPERGRAVAGWSLCGGAYDEVGRLPVSRAEEAAWAAGGSNDDDSECRAMAHSKRSRIDARCSRRDEVEVDGRSTSRVRFVRHHRSFQTTNTTDLHPPPCPSQ